MLNMKLVFDDRLAGFRHPARSICCGDALSHPHDDSFNASSERLESPLFITCAAPFLTHLCPDRGTLEPSCTPARVSHATLALMHHSPQLLCSTGPSFTPPARACSCAKLEPSRSLCTRFRPVLATPGVAGDAFWRNLYVQNGTVSTGLLSSCDPASFIEGFAID